MLVVACAVIAVHGAAAATARTATAPPRPHIVTKLIPFGPARRAETAAYAKRHYGVSTWRLRDPRVIVEHYTASDTSPYAYFAANTPDPELGELPGVCAHFVIDRDGTIYQLVRLDTICRHTVGLNWTAIGIEHVGYSARDILGDRRQLAASLKLTRWLRCRYGIATKNVTGHSESLSSPFHTERVDRLKTQTHGDMTRNTMQKYRAQLAERGAC